MHKVKWKKGAKTHEVDGDKFIITNNGDIMIAKGQLPFHAIATGKWDEAWIEEDDAAIDPVSSKRKEK